MRRIPVTLTRAHLLARVVDQVGQSQRQCEPIVNAVLTCLGDMMMEANPEVRIELRSHGTYTVRRTRPRPQARNISTGEIFTVPARRKVSFRPAARIRRRLNQSLTDLGYEAPSDHPR